MFKNIKEILILLRKMEKELLFIVSYIARKEQAESTTIRKNKNG
jgi:hypothetical protein